MINAVISFISKRASRDWERDSRILHDTLRSLLALPSDYLDITLVGHEKPDFWDMNRLQWLQATHEPPSPEDRDAKLGDGAVKKMAGIQHAHRSGYEWVMMMDADDLVSNRLPFCTNLKDHDVIVLKNGYGWRSGTRWLEVIPHFHRICGSCSLVRCTPEFFPCWLGGTERRIGDANHNEVLDLAIQAGARIQMLNEPLMIYRLGDHNHYWRKLTASEFLSKRAAARLCKRLIRSRRLTEALRNEFLIPRY